jgi:4-amino-4-deoxy-L-arabinose transferase-like glycosyltransferase
VRPALITLLACTAIAYLWDLSASGYANSFYAAAVQAGTKSWKAFFFGSIDSSNFITVDKPPASLWVMSLSGRIFGFSSMSMLVPQVLEGVAAVGLLYAAVRRWFGAGAGLAAGALLAITPVAALMFRFNNPDALLVCLLVAGAYCLTRALEHARTGWVVAAGTMIGFAFLAKMAQAFLVLPAFGLVYLIAAPTGLRRRAGQLLAGAVAIVVSCGWWVAIVELWPTGSRPFIDGTSANNVLSLVVGYNGLGRIFGASGGGGGGGGANFSGSTGTLRLFNDLMGGQASWLLPPALLALVLGLWHTRRAPRTDRTRAALLLWGGWLVVTGAIFSYSSGAIHTYYTVALAPAIAALVAIGGSMAWRERAHGSARIAAAAGVLLTAGWSWVLLDRTPHWNAWLLVLIPASLVLAAICLLAARGSKGMGGRISLIAGFLAAVACLAGPVAYSAQTISSAHTGSIPSAGPSAGRNAGSGAPGSAGGGGGSGNTTVSAALRSALASESSRYRWVLAVSGSQTAAGIELATGGDPVMAIGGFNNQGGNITLAQFKQYVAAGEIHYYMASTGGAGGSGAFAGAGHTALTAGSGRQSAPGGFGGGGAPTGGAPTLRGSGGGPAGGAAGGGISAGSTSAITSWVKAHYKAVTIGGETLYDLSQPLS